MPWCTVGSGVVHISASVPTLELRRPREAGASRFGGGVLLALVGAVVAPFLLLDGASACPVAALASQGVLLIGLVLHGLAGRRRVQIDAGGARWDGHHVAPGPITLVGDAEVGIEVQGRLVGLVDGDEAEQVARALAALWGTTWRDERDRRTPEQRAFDERVEASRHRAPELYRVVAREPASHATHEGLVYTAPEDDLPLGFEVRGIRQGDVLVRWSDLQGVGVVIDGAARLEVLTSDGIRALWLTSARRDPVAKLLWMVGEIRRQGAERGGRDEGQASDVPASLRALQRDHREER